MSIAIPNFNTEKVVSGLNTYTYTIPSAGVYYCRIEVDHHSSSQATISIAQSGSRSATLATVTLPGGSTSDPAPQSTTIQIGAANCAASDVITFVVSSSASIDQQINNIKSRLVVREGMIA